jgi:hypothetical protein
MSKWISVDEVPSYKKRVLTIDRLSVQRVLVCDFFENEIDWYDEEWEDFEDGLDVTHWMPLPEPPCKN